MSVLSALPLAIESPSAETLRALNSWKEIAAHLGLGVRTVQRYEREFGMPVRRLNGKSRSSVHAYPNELRSWLLLRTKCQTATVEDRSDLQAMLYRYRTAAEEMHASARESQRLRKEARVLRAKLHDSVAALANSAAKLMSL